ncbi:hypothetical protein T12_15249 [Trichinella patagoniensis]|uniref:Uncharacterized protein n=1 Tax=Trichinella patagoniensis TaxID=990121 RepID=A0A0V0ZIL8_9BILA|nr:hypothetical protein T12_15249 [Trichinella patagoniensis]
MRQLLPNKWRRIKAPLYDCYFPILLRNRSGMLFIALAGQPFGRRCEFSEQFSMEKFYNLKFNNFAAILMTSDMAIGLSRKLAEQERGRFAGRDVNGNAWRPLLWLRSIQATLWNDMKRNNALGSAISNNRQNAPVEEGKWATGVHDANRSAYWQCVCIH